MSKVIDADRMKFVLEDVRTLYVGGPKRTTLNRLNLTSKCMHGMNQTEAEYSRHGKRSQKASLSQIGPVVLEV